MMLPLRLTLLGRQVSISTNAPRLAQIVSAAYASPHFAPSSGDPVRFACEVSDTPLQAGARL